VQPPVARLHSFVPLLFMQSPDEEDVVEMTEEPKAKRQTFRLGDTVRILSGPFQSFTGQIEGINQVKALLKVNVTIFGRNRPIKLNFADAEVVAAS
jgi:transcriptional antiterminator NusG